MCWRHRKYLFRRSRINNNASLMRNFRLTYITSDTNNDMCSVCVCVCVCVCMCSVLVFLGVCVYIYMNVCVRVCLFSSSSQFIIYLH